jgi:hypothetical protein
LLLIEWGKGLQAKALAQQVMLSSSIRFWSAGETSRSVIVPADRGRTTASSTIPDTDTLDRASVAGRTSRRPRVIATEASNGQTETERAHKTASCARQSTSKSKRCWLAAGQPFPEKTRSPGSHIPRLEGAHAAF